METAGYGGKELIQKVLEIQQRRAAIYTALQRGFADYVQSNSELAYKELCARVTTEFNDCSRQVIQIENALREPCCNREDLAILLQTLQSHEKTKLQMTATLQILKRAGHPNERALAEAANHEMQISCSGSTGACSLSRDISGLEESEAEAEYLAAHKQVVMTLQDTVESINELMETLRYEIED